MKRLKTLKTSTFATVMAATLISINGCSQQEAILAQTMANSAAGAATSGKGARVGNAMNANMLTSPSAMSGVAQGQLVGAQMAMNPGVIGAGAVGTAISEYNKAQNRKSFGKVTDLYVNSDQVNSGMQATMVRAYNQQHGTHYKNMQELQYAVKVQRYNKKYHTCCKSMDDVREDYNKRFGTNYRTTSELLAKGKH